MNSDVTLVPLRFLNDEQAKAIAYFYTPLSPSGLFLAVYLPVVLGLSLGGAFFTAIQGLVAGAAVAGLFLLLRQWQLKRTIKRAKWVYEYGDTEELLFSGLTSNWSFKVNGAPQQIISSLRNGHPMQVKSFNANVIAVYSLPRQTAYTHPEYPGLVVPSGLFNLQRAEQRRGISLFFRRALVFGLPFAFVLGLTYFINSEMDSHSNTHAQPDAVVYRQGDRLVLATVMTRFKAYKVSNGTTYGDDSYYAEGIDLQTGKPVWKVDLDDKNSEGRSFGAARILGQSDRYLFVLRNQLCIIDKQKGQKVPPTAYSTGLQDKLPKGAITSYMDAAGYTWSDSLRAVVVKGTDGLFYTIDGATLRTGTIDIDEPDTFFANRYQYGNNYEDQLAAAYDDGTQCYAVLDPKDTTLLAHNSTGVQERPAEKSIRRSFYACPSTRQSDGWITLNKNIFLSGGLLVDATQRYQQPDDSISGLASYQSLLARYNRTNPPLRTGNGTFIILHKTTIEQNATLLLTAVASNGKQAWQVSTSYGSIPFMYHDATGNTLYLGGDTGGGVSDNLNQLLRIDLQTGTVTKYAIG